MTDGHAHALVPDERPCADVYSYAADHGMHYGVVTNKAAMLATKQTEFRDRLAARGLVLDHAFPGGFTQGTGITLRNMAAILANPNLGRDKIYGFPEGGTQLFKFTLQEPWAGELIESTLRDMGFNVTPVRIPTHAAGVEVVTRDGVDSESSAFLVRAPPLRGGTCAACFRGARAHTKGITDVLSSVLGLGTSVFMATTGSDDAQITFFALCAGIQLMALGMTCVGMPSCTMQDDVADV
jgi:hypothetical protein